MKVVAYTDGACSVNTKKGGWAVVYEINNSQEVESGNAAETTNNRMELTAVLSALEKAESLKDSEFIIYTDSAYVSNCFKDQWYVKWMTNGWMNSKKQQVENIDLWKRIIKIFLENNHRIQILKVKGHGKVEGNILADQLAVAAKERPIKEDL